MREFHPVTDIQNPVLHQRKIILGSFPTHRFTRKSESEAISDSKGYFYGGERNRFWSWYAQFADSQARKESVDTLRKSLEEHGIGITDMIYSCERKGISASDNDLKNRVYNHCFLPVPKSGETVRILCTSKGVMNNMLLSPAFFSLHPEWKISGMLSAELEEKILKDLSHSEIQVPIARVVVTENGGIIEIVSLPSPGSPYRSLKNFGLFKGSDAKQFLELYLLNAFRWFTA